MTKEQIKVSIYKILHQDDATIDKENVDVYNLMCDSLKDYKYFLDWLYIDAIQLCVSHPIYSDKIHKVLDIIEIINKLEINDIITFKIK